MRVIALLGILALAGCGIDGAPLPPPPKTPPAEEPEERPRGSSGTEITVGVSGSIGGVVRR